MSDVPSTIISELEAMGIAVIAHNGSLRLSPPHLVSKTLVDRVRPHKAAILQLLALPPLADATETWLMAVEKLAASVPIPDDVLADLRKARVRWQ